MKKDSKKNNLESIDNKIKKKEQAKKIVKEHLKPSCEEKLSQEDYPQIKD
jgi:predicted ATPase